MHRSSIGDTLFASVAIESDSNRSFESWAADQRALARILGLSISDWMDSLRDAAERKTGLTAAIVGAATARGLGLSVIGRIDASALAQRACFLLDPEPPRVSDPVLAEAIRRAQEEDLEGRGAARLKGAPKLSPQTPPRETGPNRESDQTPTADAPGEDQ
jgi:hypothetical protein